MLPWQWNVLYCYQHTGTFRVRFAKKIVLIFVQKMTRKRTWTSSPTVFLSHVGPKLSRPWALRSKRAFEIQPGFEPGSCELCSDALTNYWSSGIGAEDRWHFTVHKFSRLVFLWTLRVVTTNNRVDSKVCKQPGQLF